ncbi:plexin-A4-like, partial [Diadema antillarum]|uniref:plexin-A4-like n=1 Tax=Diadema antillarum TaxID=105358 RepID=UPI003A88F2BD
MECSYVLRIHWNLCSLVVFTCILSLIGDSTATPVSTYLRGSFRGAPGSVFNHFLVSNAGGEEFVYVGARSRIYQLDRNLAHLKNDSTDPDGCGNNCEDNDNTILAVAASPRNHLVLCRKNDGLCEYRNLTTLIILESGSSDKVVTPSELETSFVGLTGQLPNEKWYLFVAPTTRDGTGTPFVPVGIRILETDTSEPTLNLIYSTQNKETNQKVEFIDGMHWNDYMFFILQESPGSSPRSKLGRICTDDSTLSTNLDSYMEIELSCGNIASIQAAHIGPVSPQLAESLGIN